MFVELPEVIFVKTLGSSFFLNKAVYEIFLDKSYCKRSDLPKVTCLTSVRVKAAVSPVLFPLFLSGYL